MKIIPVVSYGDLERKVSGEKRCFLLIYKGGAEQSECALKRISQQDSDASLSVFTADVNEVSDIHGVLGVDTAPSLVAFRDGRVANIIKGCQTQAAYDSFLAGKELGTSGNSGTKKSKQVTVYTTPTCTWCTTLKTYLDSHQVNYREINVASDQNAAEAMVRKSGQQGVPQSEINGQMVVGFDKARINQLLEIQ
jgi:glutaredoxin-like YruB-family protein